jgi:ABC-2 type transport system permease protein
MSELGFFIDVFKASFRYSLIQIIRYLNAGWFLGPQVLGPIFFLLTSWTILQILGPTSVLHFAAISGYNAFLPFVIIGFAFQAVVMNAVWAGSDAIRTEQQWGTIEAVFVTPSNKVAWMLGKIAGNVVLALVSTVIVLATGTLALSFSVNATPNLPAAVIGISLTIFGMIAFAFVLGGVAFVVKRVEDINQVLWTSLVFFTGLAFPIEALPQWAQTVAWAFPITHGLVITRGAILNGYGVLNPSLSFAVESIVLLMLIYVPLGYFSFKIACDRARKRGVLANF